jgi:predicted secreted protein
MSVQPSAAAPIVKRLCIVLATLVAAAFPPSAALAGDTAELQILGFSRDGGFFAFEQYGIQDGSGFPYSDIFVVDVIGDSWVPPSPFRLRKDTEAGIGEAGDSALSQTRAENRLAAQPLLQEKAIAGKGQTMAFNPRTELASDPHDMLAAARDSFRPGDDPVAFTLSEYPLADAECQGYGAETKGFRLAMVRGGVTRILNDDTSVPKSRRCPLAYRIERFVTHFPDEAPPVFAVLIQMDSLGFEGPDRRYLAITGRL